jgi:hypothetical protein
LYAIAGLALVVAAPPRAGTAAPRALAARARAVLDTLRVSRR